MKVYAVITVARQVDGEYVFIKTEKAFTSAQKADECLKKIKSSTVAPDGKWKPQKIETQNGEAICQCEVGVFELDLED